MVLAARIPVPHTPETNSPPPSHQVHLFASNILFFVKIFFLAPYFRLSDETSRLVLTPVHKYFSKARLIFGVKSMDKCWIEVHPTCI